MIRIRKATEENYDFLMDMMYESIHIPENKPPKTELLNLPHLKKYNEEWGRKTDRAFVAFSGEDIPIGAVWYRLFNEHIKGYGYVDNQTPELGIAVTNEARGNGVATLLMKKIMQQANNDGYTSLSLSVDPNNSGALKLYNNLGFEKCGVSGTSWTMKLIL